MELHFLIHLTLFAIGILVVAVFGRRTGGNRRHLLAAFTVGYVARLSTLILLSSYFSVSGLFLLDDRGYDNQAMAMAFPFGSISMLQYQIGTFHVGYPLLLAWFYSLVGHSVFSARLLNAFFGAATVPVAFFLAREVTEDDRIARMALWLTALFPYDIAWSGFLLKDTVLLFLVTTAILFAVLAIKRRSLVCLTIYAGMLLLTTLFRFYTATTLLLAFIAAVAAYLVHKLVQRNDQRWVVFSTFCVLLLAAGWRILLWFMQHTILGNEFSTADIATNLTNSGYSPLVFSFSLHYLLSIVHATIVYFLGPFPWIFWGVDKLNYMFYPGMYLIYVLFPFFVLGLWRIARQLDPLKVFIVIILLAHTSLEIYAYQSGERQRMMTDVLFIICAAIGWHSKIKNEGVIRLGYFGLVLLMCGQLYTQLF